MQAVPQFIPSEPANPDADNRLRDFARQLAKTHGEVPLSAKSHMSTSGRDRVKPSQHQKTDLLERLQGWEEALRHATAIFNAVPSKDLPVSRAGEWMLDNFYVVKQTFHQIEEGLPASFLDQLPKPRVEYRNRNILAPCQYRDYFARTGTTPPRAGTGTTPHFYAGVGMG